jgi:protein phosphatase
MTLDVAVVCELGIGPELGGRERNEDNYLVCHGDVCRWRADGREQRQAQEGEGLLAAVFDGMGGHADGHVASMTAARVLSKVYQAGTIPERPARVLAKFVQDAHAKLHHAAARQGPVQMGTTLTAVWILGSHAAWIQVGDSRMYLLRAGELSRVTADQTRNEFARREGRPRASDGDHLAQNFIYGSRGLGDDTKLRLDPGVDHGVLPLSPGDRLLLCTDGVTGVLDDAALRRTLTTEPTAEAAVRRLVAEALRLESTDNATALVVAL